MSKVIDKVSMCLVTETAVKCLIANVCVLVNWHNGSLSLFLGFVIRVCKSVTLIALILQS